MKVLQEVNFEKTVGRLKIVENLRGGKEMKKVKIISVVLAIASAIGLVSGCKPVGKIPAKKISAAAGKRYDKQVEIKIPVYDRGVQNMAPVDNNYWTKWIQKNFGDKYNIKVTFIPIPRSTDIDKFNLLLASNNAPDIIFSYDYPTALSFYNRDVLQEIPESMLNKYGPDFLKWSGNTMKYGVIDGKQIFLTATRPINYNFTLLIRQDWLDKAGFKMPKSLEEYEQALLKFKELNLGGDDTIPMTYSLAGTYFEPYHLLDFPLSEKDNALYSDITVCPLSWELVHKELQRINKYYSEGLISPQWALDKDAMDAQADFVEGKAGVYGFYLSRSSTVLQTLVRNVPDAKVAVLDPRFCTPEGKTGGYRQDWPFGMLSGISKDCKNPEAVIMFLNWMCQKDVLFKLQNGIEGKTYTLENSLPKLLDYSGTERLNYSSNKDLWCLVTEAKEYGSVEKNQQVARTTYAPKGFEYLIDENYNSNEALEKSGTGYTDFLFDRPLASSAAYNGVLKSKWQEIQVKLIMAKPSEFENLYQQAVKDYLASGYQKILDEKLQAYNQMKSKK